MSGRAVDRYHPMSIETLLTLGVAAAILVVAFLLRLVVLSVLRVGLRLAGRDASWLRPQSLPSSRPRLRTRAAPAARRAASGAAVGAAALAAAVGPALAATVRALAAAHRAALRGATRAGAKVATAARAGVQGVASAAAALETWADATNARLAPRTAELALATRRSGVAVMKRLGVFLVTALATAQHFTSLAAARLRKQRSAQRVANPEPRTPEPRRPRKVIDLDRDEDPLSPAQRSRPTAGARL